MSLIEPLLTKENIEDPNLEKYSIDPLANLEKSIKMLTVNYESFEFDGSSDLEFSDHDYFNENDPVFKGSDIKYAITFLNKLVIGRIDGIIKIYNLETKAEIVLKGHSKCVVCLQVCPKKDFLISASDDKTIIIWNLESYIQERVFIGENKWLCLEVTAGYGLFSGSYEEGFIRKWNFWNEKEVEMLDGDKYEVNCMKSSPNGEFLVAGSFDGHLMIFSIQDIKNVSVLFVREGYVLQIEITDDSKYIVTGSIGGAIDIWDINARQGIRHIKHSKEGGNLFLEFTQGNQFIFANCDEGTIRTYDIDNNNSSELKDPATAVAISKQNNLVYCGHKNGSITIFNLNKGVPITTLEGIECKAVKILTVNQEEYLACIHENGKIKIYQIYKEKKQAEEDYIVSLHESSDESEDEESHHEPLKTDLKLTRDGKYAVLYHRFLLKVWSFIENQFAFSLVVHYGVCDVKISYDDKYFIFGNLRRSSIYVYSFQDMKLVRTFQDQDIAICFAISKDSNFIAASNYYGPIQCFDIQKKCKIGATEEKEEDYENIEEPGEDNEYKNTIEFLQINKTNEYIISLDRNQNVEFWSFPEKTLMQSIHMEKKVKFLKLIDNNYFLVCMENVIEIFNISEKRKIITIDDHSSPISSLEISEDERFLIFSQLDEIRMWDLIQLKDIETIKINDGCSIVSLDITRDNKYIAILNANGCVKIWNREEKKFMVTMMLSHDIWHNA
ncbi:unnamed protein product [Blepharisma stoltei]|uniref:WD40 repeat-like protein n=1 Tax=Blepharisma stoltei TaxID=1481888 RepID=A0AAU9JY32_9CILI|nr:unnamed protein product [Blepharisma stoltei]